MDQYKALLSLFGALVQAGVEDVVISPGSRSTPLAISAAVFPALRRHVLLDERSAAFFALGIAKESGRPAALICTSGTAAANFHPAVVEAREGHVPLIVLTADRPRELRDVGAAQTIDQVSLYGSSVKWFSDLPIGESAAEENYARAAGMRAVAAALAAPSGPVHINLPLREPLLPAKPLEMPPPSAYFRPDTPERRPRPAQLDAAAALLAEGRALIVAGPMPAHRHVPDLAALSARTGLPVLADPLSGVRYRHGGALDAYDLYLRDGKLREDLQPDVVLRLGALPTSKSLGTLLSNARQQVLLSGEEGWRDPLFLPGIELPGDAHLVIGGLLERLPAAPQSDFARRWRTVDRAAREATELFLTGLRELFDGTAIRDLRGLLSPQDLLFVGSSMPIRDLDGFAPGGEGPRVLSNRGANGIDGVVSSALGAARSHAGGRTALAIGDISFYHDLNGLLAAKRFDLNLCVLLLHNDGGGIFSFLPQAGRADFEEFFGTPHGLEFRHVVQMYGGSHVRPKDPAEVRSALRDALSAPGLHVVEVRTERPRSVTMHEEAFLAAQLAARASLGESRDA
jgi:2-succinyl-5-enolpyruvyl-6-hydroxy-3-cyclohexene-1-carboxylate synthase